MHMYKNVEEKNMNVLTVKYIEMNIKSILW